MNKFISVLAISFITVAVLVLGALEGTSQVPAAKSSAKVMRMVHHVASLSTGTESTILPGPVQPNEVFVLTDIVV
ncbi:MAG: hypothetical protein IPN34_13265 [Planctomycetes bacterium]|nr:hypothetical protein [Planctomycetota bacterium]